MGEDKLRIDAGPIDDGQAGKQGDQDGAPDARPARQRVAAAVGC
jgi:hypothetical protein